MPCDGPHPRRLAGPTLGFLLLSCLYALYCFDYKWSLHSVPLQQRISYFEQHWVFFLGGWFSRALLHVAWCPVPGASLAFESLLVTS